MTKDTAYRIPVRSGYTRDLTFRMAPVNKAIMNADADWITADELCLDNEAGRMLLLPFIEDVMKNPFAFGDEINILGFSAVKRLIRSLRETADLLETRYNDPALADFKRHIPVELLLPGEERTIAALSTPAEKTALLASHINVLTAFYRETADLLAALVRDYGARGFRHMAVTAV